MAASVLSKIMICFWLMGVIVSSGHRGQAATGNDLSEYESLNKKLEAIREVIISSHKPNALPQEQWQSLYTEIEKIVKSGHDIPQREFDYIYGMVADMGTFVGAQDEWARLRGLLDRLEGLAQMKKLRANLGGHQSLGGTNCQLSDLNPSCLYSFGNFTSENSPRGNCRGFSESLIFINNNFTFNKNKKYKNQCPLPEEVCRKVFGSYQNLLYPKEHDAFDQFFDWDPETCTYEIPCFENISQLSSNCFTQKDQSSAHPTVLFQDLVASFQSGADDSPFRARKLFDDKNLMRDLAGDVVVDLMLDLLMIGKHAVVPISAEGIQNELKTLKFPIVAAIAYKPAREANHAIVITGYNKDRTRLQVVDSNFPNQVVEIVRQGSELRELYKNRHGSLDAKSINIYQLGVESIDGTGRPDLMGTLKFKMPFYATLYGKSCSKLRASGSAPANEKTPSAK